MSNGTIEHTRLLHGKTIFLSASVPSDRRSDRFLVIPDAHVQINEAVVSLTRAVLSHGGRLVFGGHPSISPLVGLVAAEYAVPAATEARGRTASGEDRHGATAPLIRIFQSEAFRDHLPNETWQLFSRGFAAIHWIPAAENERFDPDIRNQPQCLKSLEAMRRAMIEQTRPAAMVCIGGMEGVIEETRLYRSIRPLGQIYVFETTGGAAYILARQEEAHIQVIDRRILARLAESPPEWIGPEEPAFELSPDVESTEHDIRVIPYSLICQLLVQEIADREIGGSN